MGSGFYAAKTLSIQFDLMHLFSAFEFMLNTPHRGMMIPPHAELHILFRNTKEESV